MLALRRTVATLAAGACLASSMAGCAAPQTKTSTVLQFRQSAAVTLTGDKGGAYHFRARVANPRVISGKEARRRVGNYTNADTALADVTQVRCFDISYVYTGNTAGDSPDEAVRSPDITIVGEGNVAANRIRNFATQLCGTVELPGLPRSPQDLVPNQTYNQTFVSFSVDDASQPGVEATGLRMETPPGTVMTWRHNL
ncbi:hypothetical protein [Corynebacterium sp. NML130628]|uniref:hypothetical protein n=1 Tax=Corynebacterium sp. NML130628 TaxID=1906333 RepID=UPI0015A532F6|nr:hypothetical protein [Corynebacterium sp. NML130628]